MVLFLDLFVSFNLFILSIPRLLTVKCKYLYRLYHKQHLLLSVLNVRTLEKREPQEKVQLVQGSEKSSVRTLALGWDTSQDAHNDYCI